MSSLLSSLGSAALGGLDSLTGGWLQNSAKESLNKNIGLTNLKLQKKYDVWTQDMDKAYEQWFQEYILGLQKNQYYNLAKQYALNTASWAVEGLKRAGLNPILAGIDSNLSSSMGNANPMNSGHSTGGGSIRGASVSTSTPSHNVDLASAMQKNSAAKQADASAEQAKVQTDIAKETKEAQIQQSIANANNADLTSKQLGASTAESLARAKLIDAQADETRAKIDKIKIDTNNADRNSGLNGTAGFGARSLREVGDAIDRTIKATVDTLNGSRDGNTGVKAGPHSAKKLSYDLYKDIPEIRVFHDGEKSFLPPTHVKQPAKFKYDWHKSKK